jgi:hypothetical protein
VAAAIKITNYFFASKLYFIDAIIVFMDELSCFLRIINYFITNMCL